MTDECKGLLILLLQVWESRRVGCLPLASESASELDVLRLDGNSLGVDGLVEQSNSVSNETHHLRI
jgi:hypothetical protein